MYTGELRFGEDAKIMVKYNSEDQSFLIIVFDDANEKIYGYEGTVTEGS